MFSTFQRPTTSPSPSVVPTDGDLRVGERDRRDRAVVGLRRPAGDVGRRDPRLVLAEVGELRMRRAVADRPDVLGGAQALVGLDPALRDRRAELFETEALRVRPRGRWRREPDGQALSLTRLAVERSAPKTHLDPLLLERGPEEHRRLGVEARDQPRRSAGRSSPPSRAAGRAARARSRRRRRRARPGSPAPRARRSRRSCARPRCLRAPAA